MSALVYLRSLTALTLYSESSDSLLSCFRELQESDIDDCTLEDADMIEALEDELIARGEL